MKVALVHEFLNQLGGAEKVLENFLEIWPDAVLHVILYDKTKSKGQFEKAKKKISFLDKFPLSHSHPRLLLPMMPMAIESFNFDDYDVVFSDSSSFAKGARAGNKLHICYCHTPTRFLWTEHEYLNYQKYPKFLKKLGASVLPKLKKWDFNSAQRPNFFIANSVNVQNRVKSFYKRDSVVIPPPVDSDFYKPMNKKDYFLVVTRLEPYKKVDIIVDAFNELGLPLKIVGTGTIENELKSKAKPNIEFLGRISDLELQKVYGEAKAFVFAAQEDAGIVFLEAQAAGAPVLAYKAGGALEAVVSNVTGEFFSQQTAQSLIEALKTFNPGSYDVTKLRSNAERYSKQNFQKKIKEFVEEKFLKSARDDIKIKDIPAMIGKDN
jgi:glycosyltransferase involved in cell wall biosynthesis